MRVTPKMSDSPAATRNRPDALASPLSAWNRKASKDIASYPASSCPALCRASRLMRHRRAFVNEMAGTSPAMTTQKVPPGSVRGAGAQLLGFLLGGEHRGAVDIFEVRHGALAILQRDLAHIGPHRRLMVAGAVAERSEG